MSLEEFKRLLKSCSPRAVCEEISDLRDSRDVPELVMIAFNEEQFLVLMRMCIEESLGVIPRHEFILFRYDEESR